MKAYFYCSIILMLFLAACSNPLKEKEEKLIEQVYYIHDVETMPKMGTLEVLKSKLDTFQGVDKKVIFSNKRKLDTAYDAMMDWMAQYNAPSDEMPIEQRIAYYESQVGKLEKMKKIMFDAMDEARATLKMKGE